MTKYSVNVELDNETLDALKNGFEMQVFKAVKAANSSGAFPTVWFKVQEFSSSVAASWSETYGGYFSHAELIEGVTVIPSTQQPMNPGDVIILAKDGSSSTSTVGGRDDVFCFQSQREETWASGLMVAPEGQKLAPVCAFPQYGAVGNLIQPYQKILLLFTQKQLDTGAVVETAVSESVSITLSTSIPSITVGFNINKGWDTKGSTQVRVNPINFVMAPDLIIPSPSLANMMKDLAGTDAGR